MVLGNVERLKVMVIVYNFGIVLKRKAHTRENFLHFTLDDGDRMQRAERLAERDRHIIARRIAQFLKRFPLRKLFLFGSNRLCGFGFQQVDLLPDGALLLAGKLPEALEEVCNPPFFAEIGDAEFFDAQKAANRLQLLLQLRAQRFYFLFHLYLSFYPA